MDKNFWDDIVKEPMSEGLKARTLARARQELDANKAKSFFSIKLLAPLVPGLALLFFYIRQPKDDSSQVALQDYEVMDDLMDMSSQELAELDEHLINDLEFFEDLEFLEEWDGRSTES